MRPFDLSAATRANSLAARLRGLSPGLTVPSFRTIGAWASAAGQRAATTTMVETSASAATGAGRRRWLMAVSSWAGWDESDWRCNTPRTPRESIQWPRDTREPRRGRGPAGQPPGVDGDDAPAVPLPARRRPRALHCVTSEDLGEMAPGGR